MDEGVSVQHEDLSLCFGNLNIRLKPAHKSKNARNPHELTRLSKRHGRADMIIEKQEYHYAPCFVRDTLLLNKLKHIYDLGRQELSGKSRQLHQAL